MKIRKRKFLDEVQETEPELIEKTVRVLNSIECLRVTEGVISLSAGADSNEQQTTEAGLRFMRMLASCCEEILMGKETFLVSVSFTISSVTQANSLP